MTPKSATDRLTNVRPGLTDEKSRRGRKRSLLGRQSSRLACEGVVAEVLPFLPSQKWLFDVTK